MAGKKQKKEVEAAAELPAKPENDDDSESDASSSSEEDDALVLEGALMRNPDVSDSDDTSSGKDEESDDDSNDSDNNDDDDDDTKPSSSKRRAKQKSDSKKPAAKKHKKNPPKSDGKTKDVRKTKKKNNSSGPEILDVEFIFCDMAENYFHGLKTLLTASSPAYLAHSSALSDIMIQNVSVGTVVSTQGDVDGNVFGFASVLNVTTYQKHECIQALKKMCLDKCPDNRKPELQTVLSGKTNRPAGFLLHGRMVNMPLEVVEVLHQQLVKDMDWAVKQGGDEDQRKSHDFGAFVRLAPTYRMAQAVAYKFFDDEIFAQHAEFAYEIELPKSLGMEETPYCSVLVMTKTGHRAAMKDMAEMISGSKVAAT